MNSSPTIEERFWAVLSHLAALSFGMGLALTILGWSEQRRKSKYASFQCLQALGYQSLGYTVWLLSYLVLAILVLVVVIVASFLEQRNGVSNGPLGGVVAGLFSLGFFGLFALYLVLPLIGAVACALGMEFRYPILGKRLARYLGYDLTVPAHETASLNADHEERWVAAMGHFSVIIFLWGMLAPAFTWVLQGRQSAFLKLQSIQTTVYQAFVNLLYLGAMVLSFAGMIPVLLWAGLQSNSNSNSPAFILGLVLFIFSLLAILLALLVIPLFHILGQWAGYRVLKGDDYRYPLLGKLVEKRLAKSYGVQELAPEANSKLFDSTVDSKKETL